MTSISGYSLASLQSVQALLNKNVATGAVSATDKGAIGSALKDIGGALGSTGTSATDRVSGLIDGEVSGGKLTSAQATELKALFAKVQAGGDVGATSATSATASTTSTDGTGGIVSGARGILDGLTSFVSNVRDAVKGNGLYGAGGNTIGRVGSLLVNAFA